MFLFFQKLRNSRECTPRGRELEQPCVRRRQPSPQEGVVKEKVSRPEATFRRCPPNACSSPARAKRPAVDDKQGPHVPRHDSRAKNKRAERPRSIRAQRTSRRKRPNMLMLQKDRAARSCNTPEIEKVISPKGGNDVDQPASPTRLITSRDPQDSVPEQQHRILTNNAESSVTEPNTEVQRAKMTLQQKQCTAKRRERRIKGARMKQNFIDKSRINLPGRT